MDTPALGEFGFKPSGKGALLSASNLAAPGATYQVAACESIGEGEATGLPPLLVNATTLFQK